MPKRNILGAALLWLGLCSGLQAQLPVKSVAAGLWGGLAVTSDGSVWQWGPYSPLAQVGGLTNVASVAVGASNVAITNNGDVWAWGSMWSGNGTTAYTRAPVQLKSLAGAVAAAGGYDYALVLKSDGTIWSWGGSIAGQWSTAPVQVTGLSGVTAIAGGTHHGLAVKSDGTVWAWGDNLYGQLGGGALHSDSAVPVQVSGLTGVKTVAGGWGHSLALKRDGTVWAWGLNNVGQLGDGTMVSRSTPAQVSDLTGVVAITAGEWHNLAMKADGTVWAWGYNAYGELGDGTVTTRLTPVQVSGLGSVVSIVGGHAHTLAVQTDGGLIGWGSNYGGQLIGAETYMRRTAAQVNGLADMVAVAGGYNASIALHRDGTVWQFPNSDWLMPATPVEGLSDVVAIAAGDDCKLALKSDGTVWQWGSWENPWSPPVQVAGLGGIIKIAVGWSAWDGGTRMALKEDGSVWAWWPRWNGATMVELAAAPVLVSGLTGIKAIASGCDGDDLALKDDGTVWGRSSNGWAAVSGLAGVTAISANCAEKAAANSDSLWVWSDDLLWPVSGLSSEFRSLALPNVAALAAGSAHILALRSDGTVWAHGINDTGQLGDGTTQTRNTPVQVGGLSEVAAIAGGGGYSLAVKRDGTVWTWGHNGQGQLGDGNSAYIYTAPVRLVQPGAPDLAITMTHSSNFTVGDPGMYTLTVTNKGFSATKGTLTVTDMLPPGLTYVSGGETGWVCAAEGQIVTCTNAGPLNPTASTSFTLTVDVTAAAWPGVTNLATITNESDRNLANNTAADSVAVLLAK